MRKSFYTLSGLIRTKMGKDPLDGSVYVFINARCDRIKLLHMEPGGLVLYMKFLERGELHVSQRLSGPGTKAIGKHPIKDVYLVCWIIADDTSSPAWWRTKRRRRPPLQPSAGCTPLSTMPILPASALKSARRNDRRRCIL